MMEHGGEEGTTEKLEERQSSKKKEKEFPN